MFNASHTIMNNAMHNGVGTDSGSLRFCVKAFSEIVENLGIKIALHVIELVRHFFYAPSHMISSFVLSLLKEKGVNSSHQMLILSLASQKQTFGPKTNNEIAEIIKNSDLDISIPSYCLGNKFKVCIFCKEQLSNWKSKSKKSHVNRSFSLGRSAKVITGDGSFNALIFRTECIPCGVIYDINKYSRRG